MGVQPNSRDSWIVNKTNTKLLIGGSTFLPNGFVSEVPNRETGRVLKDARKSSKRSKYTTARTPEEFALLLNQGTKRVGQNFK